MMVGAVSQSAMAGAVGWIMGVGSRKCNALYSAYDGSVQQGLLNEAVTYAEGSLQSEEEAFILASNGMKRKINSFSDVISTDDERVDLEKLIESGIRSHCSKNMDETIYKAIRETEDDISMRYLYGIQ